MSEIKTISVDNLFIDPNNIRTSDNPRIDEDFRESIRQLGVINPLTVREKDVPSTDSPDKKGTPEAPAGNQEYWIVAGRRRFLAAVEVGIPEIDCVIEEYSDEEAIRASFDENEQRVPTSQFELAKSVKRRYDLLAEDLVGEDETVECPECGKTTDDFKGIGGFLGHVKSVHDIDDPFSESREGYLTKKEIYEEIAESSSFDTDTVERLIQVAKIPEQFQTFVKIAEERSNQEDEKVSDLLSNGFTFASSRKDSTLSQKSIDFSRFANSVPPRLVERTLQEKNFRQADTAKTSQLFKGVRKMWEDYWQEEEIAEGVAYNRCLSGTKPTEKEEPADESDERTGEEQEEKSNDSVDEEEMEEDQQETEEKEDVIDEEDITSKQTEEPEEKESKSEEEKEVQEKTRLYVAIEETNKKKTIDGEYTDGEVSEALDIAIDSMEEYLEGED